MTNKSDILFEVLTPLGFRVRVTHAYWKLIIDIKHPVIAGREGDVRKTLPRHCERSRAQVVLRNEAISHNITAVNRI